eukprot:TRINITY_DN7143_c0_g1_i1.p1 TRINITY_DN7143_c0_g1~~TRINITY_DN7143_c0_g1_i1.p1  ORF type:complete len:1081 (+),score=168.97 TRINITY_DN7143_c0_g1_i1:3703-6945(+)
MDEYPVEIRQSPLPLVTLIGEQRWTGLRKQIADHFLETSEDSGRRDSLKLFTKYSDIEESLQIPKEGRISSEFYRPLGIFKTKWMFKHLHIIPAAAVGIFTWEDEGDWRIREISLSRNIEQIKFNISSRNTKFVLVLVQEKKISADPLNEERYTSLRRKCELENKAVTFFYLDDFAGSIKRLEKCLSEATTAYYREEAKVIKKNKEFASRKLAPQMITRYNMKIAFFAECRFETKKAIKYYNAAYNALQEVTDPLYLVTELKTIAEIIHFKICSLNVSIVNISDAIEQFKRHIRIYKKEYGPVSIEFLHWAWMARQFCVFAELLEKINVESNFYDFYQHPGYYFHDAAINMRKRKAVVDRMRESLNDAPSKKDGYRDTYQVYIGQYFPYQPDDLEDLSKKEFSIPANVILGLQNEECKVSHSENVSYLLTRALDHFTKAPIMIYKHAHILVTLAEEYINQGKHDQAKSSLELALVHYEDSEWHAITTHILSLLRDCAVQRKNIEEFCRLSWLLIIPTRTKSALERAEILDHLKQLVGMSSMSNGPFGRLSEPITLIFRQTTPFFTTKLKFCSDSTFVNNSVNLQLLIESKAPSALTLSSINFVFNEASYNQSISRSNADIQATDLYSEKVADPGRSPQQISELLFFEPRRPKLLNVPICVRDCIELKCLSIVLEFGNGTSCIRIQIEMDPSLNVTKGSPQEVPLLSSKHSKFLEKYTLRVLQPQSRISIQVMHENPAVLNEFHPVTIMIRPVDTEIRVGTMEIKESSKRANLECHVFTQDKQLCIEPITIGKILKGDTHCLSLFVKANHACKQSYNIKFTYNTAHGYQEVSEQNIHVEFSNTFHHKCRITYEHMNHSLLEHGPDHVLPLQEEAFLHVEIESTVRAPILLKSAELINLNNEYVSCTFATQPQSIIAQLPNQAVMTGGKFSICIPVTALKPVKSTRLGFIKIVWSRKDSSDEGFMTLSLPEVSIVRRPLKVDIDVDVKATVGVPLLLRLRAQNTTTLHRGLSIRIGASPSFFIGGHKVADIAISPLSQCNMTFLLLPLEAGQWSFPTITLVDGRDRSTAFEWKDKQIFVLPS